MAGAGRTLRLAHRGDSRGAREQLAALLAAMAIAAATGSNSMFGRRPMASPSSSTTHHCSGSRGRTRAVESLTAVALGRVRRPSLADVLEAADRRAFLDVELKTNPARAHQILAAGRGPDLTGAVISSFSEAALVRIGRLAPSWPRWLNSHTLESSVMELAGRLGCVGVCAQWESVDQEAMDRATAAGLTIAAYTVRDQATFDRLANLGVAAVCVEAEALDG